MKQPHLHAPLVDQLRDGLAGKRCVAQRAEERDKDLRR
jgi:hypothetical protein